MTVTAEAATPGSANLRDSIPFQPHVIDESEARLLVLEERLPKIDGNFVGKSVVAMSQCEPADIELLFKETDIVYREEQAGEATENLKGKRVALEFFEDSTRTRFSSDAAAGGDGAHVIGFSSRAGTSGDGKHESDEDTVKNMDRYVHLHVIRHPEDGFVPERALDLQHPIINGGNGAGEHPSQAFLDGYTICKLLGQIEGKRFTFYGDMIKGRTGHSTAQLLAMMGAAELNFVAPIELQMPGRIIHIVEGYGTRTTVTDNIEEVIERTDALYRLRTQLERFAKAKRAAIASMVPMVTTQLLDKGPDGIQFLHPGPEDKLNPDYTPEVRRDRRYKVLFQAEMGLSVRRALMRLMLDRANVA